MAETMTTTHQVGARENAARPWPSALAATDSASRVSASARANVRADGGDLAAQPHQRPGRGAGVDHDRQQPRQLRGEPAHEREIAQRGERQHRGGRGHDADQGVEDDARAHRDHPHDPASRPMVW